MSRLTIEFSSECNIWSLMKHRCLNKNDKRYKDYGGRGINVCKRWMKFENFLKDMGKRPKGMSLDRINNDGNYEPKNCRWATEWIQKNNTSRNRHIKYKGQIKTLAQWIKLLHLKSSTVRQRFYVYKWDIKRCFKY